MLQVGHIDREAREAGCVVAGCVVAGCEVEAAGEVGV
jgi:hypothetical protein